METPVGYLLLPTPAGVWAPGAPTLRADDHLCSPQSTVWENELAITECRGFAKCLPIIKSVPAVKTGEKRPASHWAGSGASEKRAGQLASR